MKMIVKAAKIKFDRFFRIGPILKYNVKKYLNTNTGDKYMDGKILNLVYEFRFINGKKYIYKHSYERCNLDSLLTHKIMKEFIDPVKDFIDLVILYIEKE